MRFTMIITGYKLGFIIQDKNYKSYNYLTFLMKLKCLRKKMLRTSQVKTRGVMILISLLILISKIFKSDLVNTQGEKYAINIWGKI